ncbi:MAG: adenosylcobinamide-GDP ribazoletransferase [Nitrosomonas sp.]|nr:adenosylcobinamide-GDP ribazoletransferase [Nitrosomonas sp.]MDP1950226.1 adenosylcobinamide-GDP ribazoletransferase [Nitrosomonas sp.]
MIYSFLIALQFLTQFPVRFDSKPSQKLIGYSIVFYPIIGLLIGSILAALGWLLSDAPPLVATALLLTTWVFLTGGLHLDGLADSADAWVGGMGNREKTLAIMKDPYCGPSGVVAIAMLLLLKFVTLYTLLVIDEWIIFILATMLGRTVLPLLFLTTPYVRSNGLGSILAANLPRRTSIIVVATTAALIPPFAGIQALWLLLSAFVIFWILRHLMLRRIGGTTGDTAGALVEITETTMLLAAVLMKV